MNSKKDYWNKRMTPEEFKDRFTYWLNGGYFVDSSNRISFSLQHYEGPVDVVKVEYYGNVFCYLLRLRSRGYNENICIFVQTPNKNLRKYKQYIDAVMVQGRENVFYLRSFEHRECGTMAQFLNMMYANIANSFSSFDSRNNRLIGLLSAIDERELKYKRKVGDV